MAANLQATGRFIARRAMNQISTGLAGRGRAPATNRRGVHVSTYDKNLDDQVRPATVPDDVIQLQSDNYWAPHPKTGVFGPADGGGGGGGDRLNLQSNGDDGGGGDRLNLQSNGDDGGGGSVLDQTAWFRPAEGVDEPTYS